MTKIENGFTRWKRWASRVARNFGVVHLMPNDDELFNLYENGNNYLDVKLREYVNGKDTGNGRTLRELVALAG